MPNLSMTAIDWSSAPEGLDSIASDLNAMRAADGGPSFGEIARRIARQRAARGLSEHEQSVARSTVYDCFRAGRRRIDVGIVVEIAGALGLPATVMPDWAARVRAARAASAGASVVTNHVSVPRPVETFTGRDRQLGRATDQIARDRAVWVSGMGGAGKTQFALALAERLGGGVFVDLRGYWAESPTVEVRAAQCAILRLLGADDRAEASDDERADSVAEAMRATNAVVVLDDAPNADYVARLIGSAPSRVIVTSRAPAHAGWHAVELTGLDDDEIRVLLGRFAPTDVDDGHVERLRAITEGLPLAIALVGGRFASHPTWTVDEQLQLLEERVASGHLDRDLAQTIAGSYDDLGDEAALLLRLFSDLPVAELDAEAIAALMQVSADRAAELQADLTARSLTIRRGEAVALHALVRAFGRDRAYETDPPRERSAAFARLGWHYADRVWAAYEVIAAATGAGVRKTRFAYESRPWSREEADAWHATHLTPILALAHAAAERGHPELLFRISEGASWWLNLAGFHDEAERLHGDAADIAAREGDADALAMASLDVGQILLHRSRAFEAQEHFERAMRLVDDVGDLNDPGLLGVILNMSAVLEVRRARYGDAVELLRQARDIHERASETGRYLSASVNLGVALHESGRFAEERETIDEGLRIAEENGQELFVANFLVNDVALRVEEGDLDRAADVGERAIAAAAALGAPFFEAAARASVAEAARLGGRHEVARAQADRAVELAREVGDGLSLAEALLVAARVATDGGDRPAAHAAVDEAESLLNTDADASQRGQVLLLRGDLAEQEEDRIAHWEAARATFVAAGSPRVREADARLG